MVSVGSRGMKRSTRSFVDKGLRSGKRLFADRYEEELKRVRMISVAFVDNHVNKIKLINWGMEIDDDVQTESVKLGKFKKNLKINRTDEVLEIDLGESKEMSLIGDNHDDGDNASRIKRFGFVYTRKRKRAAPTDSSLKFEGFDENHGSDKMYGKKVVGTSLETGFDGKFVLKKMPIVFAASYSNGSDVNSCSIYWFSCFVSSVLRYLRVTKLFSWRLFYSFLLLEPNSSLYSSIGNRFLQHLTDKNATIDTLKWDPPLDKVVVGKRARSARKRISRVSRFNNPSQTNASAHVESIVPVPGVREIVGYAEENYVHFMLPDSYIRSRGDEVSRTLETSCPLYDMDSDDEQWLKKLDNECVSEDVFEKAIGAFERGIYCSPHDYSEAALAVDRCLELASKEVLEAVYCYWMTKRKKARSVLVRVFQCYKQKRVKRHFVSAVLRKKRSFRRRASQRFAEKQLDFKKAILNDEKLLKESSKAYIKLRETQEAAKRSEESFIVKRLQAQTLMEVADMAVYRATMALKIAEALRAGGSVNHVTGATFGSLVE